MTDDNLNTDINYSSSYISRKSQSNPDDANNILSGETMNYIKSLASVAAAPQEKISNADYYPGDEGDRNVIKGYYQGSILGSMPLVASSTMFPFAAMDKQAQQAKLKKQAEDALYLQSKNIEYNHIKDAIKDNHFVVGQMDTYNRQLKQFTHDLGDYKGTIAYGKSDLYRLTKMKYNNYERLFNEVFDKAHQVDVARRTQHMPDETEKETSTTTTKGEKNSDITTSSVSKKAGVYVSPETSDALDNFMYYAGIDPKNADQENPNVHLETMDELAKYAKKFQLAQAADEAFSDPINSLANSTSAEIKKLVDGKIWQQTQAENPYYIEEKTGKDFEDFAFQKNTNGEIINDKDGNPVYTPSFNAYYDKAYRFLDEDDKQMARHKKEIYNQEKAAIASKVKDQAYNIQRGLGTAVEWAREGREAKKETPIIKKSSDTIVINGKVVQTQGHWNVAASSTGNKNLNPLNTYGTSVKDGKATTLSGDYYTGDVYTDENGENKAIVSDKQYTAIDDRGNALYQKDGQWYDDENKEKTPTKFIKNPDAKEYVVDYNSVQSGVETNFDLQNFSGQVTPAKYQTGAKTTTKKTGLPDDPNN